MDWSHLIRLEDHTTATCYFFDRLNKKSIDTIEAGMDRGEKRFEERMDKNEAYGREMFRDMNHRMDGASSHNTSRGKRGAKQ